MSDKQKKFEPSIGWLVAIQYQQVGLVRIAKEAGINIEVDTKPIVNKLLEYKSKLPVI